MTPPLLGPNGQPIDVGAARDELGTLDRQVVDLRVHMLAKGRAERVMRQLREREAYARGRGWALVPSFAPEGYEQGVYVATCRLEPISPKLERRLRRMDPPLSYVEGRAEFDEAAHFAAALFAAIDGALEFAKERVE